MRRMLNVALLLSALGALAGCDVKWPWAGADHAQQVANSSASLMTSPAGVGPPLGGVPGGLRIEGEPNMANPRNGQPQALAEGHRLFLAMNCASCHGYDAKGGMGPNLTDKQWRYAGTPAALFNSIAQGRPQGMPSWGRTLPSEQIWSIVAYLESLGGTYQPGQYNASLEGDTDTTQLAPGYTTVERVTASLAPPQPQPPATPEATTTPDLKQ